MRTLLATIFSAALLIATPAVAGNVVSSNGNIITSGTGLPVTIGGTLVYPDGDNSGPGTPGSSGGGGPDGPGSPGGKDKQNASEHNGKGGNDSKGGKSRDGGKNSDRGGKK